MADLGDTSMQPALSGGSRTFFQERLSLFGRWFTIVAAAYYLISNFPTDAILGYKFDWVSEYFGTHEVLNLGIIASAAIVWLATRGPARPLRALLAVDTFGAIVPLLLLAVSAFLTRAPAREVDELVSVIVGAATVIIVRAIVV